MPPLSTHNSIPLIRLCSFPVSRFSQHFSPSTTAWIKVPKRLTRKSPSCYKITGITTPWKKQGFKFTDLKTGFVINLMRALASCFQEAWSHITVRICLTKPQWSAGIYDKINSKIDTWQNITYVSNMSIALLPATSCQYQLLVQPSGKLQSRRGWFYRLLDEKSEVYFNCD